MLDDLVEEVPGPKGRIRFRHPNRAVSVGAFALSLPFLVMACIFYKVSGPVEWPTGGSQSYDVESQRSAFLCGSAFCGVIGLVFAYAAFNLVWTLRHLEIDVERRTLLDVKRTPFRQHSKEYGRDAIELIVLRENSPSENDASPLVPNCSVEVQFYKGLDLPLGSGSDWRAKRLAQRISDLTGVKLREVKNPRLL